MTQHIYLARIHNRRTDDEFKAFASEAAAKKYLREIQAERHWGRAVENSQYGDWCLFINDGYYLSLEKIEIVNQ